MTLNIQKLWKAKGFKYYLHYKTFTMYNMLCKSKKEAEEFKEMRDKNIKKELQSNERGRIRKL